MAPKSKPLTIRDEVHGDITFDAVLRQVIDHPWFQRLRYIKQLGLAEYVFPCATHTRFQHCLGAAHLAGEYFRNLLRMWLISNFHFEEAPGKTRFHTQRTFEAVHQVSEHGLSREFWWQTASLAGMLHDVGHGPWSHTFEILMLDQDFSDVTRDIPGTIGEYLRGRQVQGKMLQHEDLSVIYIYRILADLEARRWLPDAMRFFLPVASLVNRKLGQGEYGAALRQELEEGLTSRGVRGGADFHRLLGPLISGPFDVDRMDYIQRDGRNCGVSIGGIEWRRIVSKLMPCLADHPNAKGEPTDVVLITNSKNQHVLDDFIFSLFQMYTQVYMHPKIVGIEETIRSLVENRAGKGTGGTITFERHASFTDDGFRGFLKNEFGAPAVEDILLRKQGATFRVSTSPLNQEMERQLLENGYTPLRNLDRPMMKDGVGVYLYSRFRESSPNVSSGTHHLMPWDEVSPVAKHFYSINYSPKIWIKSDRTGG